MARIFLSYRRDDTAAIVGRIYDRLQAQFGREAVFMDIDAIPLGADFRVHISHAVSQCDAVLVIIGERWISTGVAGARRLDDPADFVRIEIEAALERGLAVIPVLVGSAAMPQSESLPGRLADLIYRNAASLDVGKDFNAHMDRLIRGLEGVLDARASRPAGSRPEHPTVGVTKSETRKDSPEAALPTPSAVASLVDDSLAAVKVETGSGMGSAWINAENLHQEWRRLSELTHGAEIPVLCQVLGETRPFQVHWVALTFLTFSAQFMGDDADNRRILVAACDQIPKGGHQQSAALSLIRSLPLPPGDVFEPLLLAVRLTPPAQAREPLEALSLVTPRDQVEVTTATAIRVLRMLTSDSHDGPPIVEIIRSLGHRGAAASLRQMMRGQSHQTTAAIATLLADWNDEQAAVNIREYIDAQHSSAGQLYILHTLRALFRIEGPSSRRYIAEILRRCHPYVQRYLASDYLGELLQEPVIIETIKDVHDTTRDPEIKRGLAPFVERCRS